MNLQDAEKMARDLMALHGLTDWDFGFSYRWGRSRYLIPRMIRLGCCSFGGDGFEAFGRGRNVRYVRSYRKPKITLNALFVETDDEQIVRETILHEIGHALTKGHYHDKVWRETVLRIGGKPERLCSAEVKIPGGITSKPRSHAQLPLPLGESEAHP